MFGASAIADRRDVIPAAVTGIGGEIEHFGMPVDPGNLLLIARAGGVPVLGAPGCARSPVENGFDWVLMRLLAGIRVTRSELMGMGVGGLLMEIVTRPQPRAKPETEGNRQVAAIVLAAGRSTRMGAPKPLLPWGRTTLLGEVVNRLSQCAVSEIVVVTGAEREAVEALLLGTSAHTAFNPDFESSEMARSLQIGLAHLHPKTSAIIVALADQPQIEPEVVNALLQRWRETLAPVTAPTHHGQRGHPMLFDRAAWPAIAHLPPTANPREVLRGLASIERVEVHTASILLDLDTPADYERARQGLV